MTEKHLHVSHLDVVKRLKRAHGHLANVIAMFENHRSCSDMRASQDTASFDS